ncbi:hypothetical protein MYX78_06930, partial [Acidobacteria bacterium AH-259-G07]|nr:hypothetical protein [Acidobacteria bacterium AH-259-G07]
MRAEAEGFRSLARTAVVRVGSTTTVNIQLPLGILRQVVEAIDVLPDISHDSYSIDGVVSRFEIENLPLNGREFLQLSVLEPGVMAAPMAGFLTRQFDVSVLGASPDRTRVTMDGGAIHNALGGGVPQNFSQEVVQEFQLSSVNFDLSTGLTGSGAINVVTRSGGNDYHGAGLFFFRDHNLAAYPALERDPSNPDPFFARRQAGFHLSGPIKRDGLFFFANFEDNNQDGVVSVQPRTPAFSELGGVFANPFDSTQASGRIDWQASDEHNVFFRYSHDENDGFSPPTGEGRLPSNWAQTSNWA